MASPSARPSPRRPARSPPPPASPTSAPAPPPTRLRPPPLPTGGRGGGGGEKVGWGQVGEKSRGEMRGGGRCVPPLGEVTIEWQPVGDAQPLERGRRIGGVAPRAQHHAPLRRIETRRRVARGR